MPHFIVECSKNILADLSKKKLMKAVYQAAESTGLFAEGDIKVRIKAYKYYKLGKGKKSFLHVFGHIMQGRDAQQKKDLSQRVVKRLTELIPDASFISMNVADFEKETYCNKSLIDPLNTEKDRHYKNIPG
jgi:5-carboxymethyl-2-hydroxymuconate isomerase